jgi:hypothetical protein
VRKVTTFFFFETEGQGRLQLKSSTGLILSKVEVSIIDKVREFASV